MIPDTLPLALGLPDPPLSSSPIGSGHIHQTFLATYCDGPALVHQCLNTVVFPEPEKVMDNLVAVTSHVRALLNGSPDTARRVLRPVPLADGSSHLHRDAEGATWRTFHFVPDTVTYDIAPSGSVAFRVAHTFGTFQAQLGSLDPGSLHETLPGFHDTPARLAAFHEALDYNPAGRAESLVPHLDAIVRLASIADSLTGAGLPRRAIHYDTKINNVLLDRATGEGLCVVDLDTLMPGLVPFDFGDLVRSAANPAAEDETDLTKVHVDLDLFAALASGFIRGCGDQLSTAERKALPVAGAVIAYELALRFFTDYLLGDTYFAVARPSHNYDRGAAQLHLAQSFFDQRASLESAIARV